MDSDPALAALDRLESALARLERATSALPAPDSDLARRHAALRGEVSLALQQLDSLIAGHTEGGEAP